MATVAQNGHTVEAAAMDAVFPEAHAPLQEADPELAAILADEQRRQWCARPPPHAGV